LTAGLEIFYFDFTFSHLWILGICLETTLELEMGGQRRRKSNRMELEWFGKGRREICVAVKGRTAQGRKVPQSQHICSISSKYTPTKNRKYLMILPLLPNPTQTSIQFINYSPESELNLRLNLASCISTNNQQIIRINPHVPVLY
jgi:hypothetical protein